MSKEVHEDMLWQQIEQEVMTEHEDGLLEQEIFSYYRIGPVSYTHLTLPTIYSV